MSELDKTWVVGWLEHPDLVTEERLEDILQSLGTLSRDDPAWLVATFADPRFSLGSRKALAKLLLGPIREQILSTLG